MMPRIDWVDVAMFVVCFLVTLIVIAMILSVAGEVI